jgi:hypothetical protein
MANLFNVPDPDNQNDKSVTTTSQATITFAGAPAAITLVWRVLSTVIPGIASGTAFPIVLSIVVGMAIYYFSAPQPAENRQKALNFLFAFINSFAIAATTLGINSTLTGTPATSTTPTNPAGLSIPSPVPSSPTSLPTR